MALTKYSALRSFIGIFLAALACVSCAEGEKKPAMMGFPPAEVKMETVRVAPYREQSEYIGTVKSRKSVTLQPHVEGHITQISVSAGDFVKPGQKIMQIDSRQQAAQTNSFEAAAETVQSDLATAKATLASLESSLRSKLSNVDFTKAQYQRYQSLAGQGAVAQSELDSWKNSYSAACADRDAILQQIEGQKTTIQKYERSYKQATSSYQAQKEQLRYYEIVAPFEGIIGDIPVKLGDHVLTSTALTTLTENQPLEIYVAVPAEKAGEMRKGMSVALRSSNGSDFGDSKVIFISPTVDSSSQTVLVKTLFPNSKDQLRVDQTVKAVVVWNEKPGICVPTAAVSQTAGKHFVFLAETGKDGKKAAHQVEIETYGIEGDSFQVKSGLKAGDVVITTGIQRLADGAPILEKHDSKPGGKLVESIKRFARSR